MAHYVTLVRYTQQGISKIKDSPSRLDGAKKAAEAEGGKIHTWHLTMGQYDAVFLFPNSPAMKLARSLPSQLVHLEISPPRL